jgi:hypothetical protein
VQARRERPPDFRFRHLLRLTTLVENGCAKDTDQDKGNTLAAGASRAAALPDGNCVLISVLNLNVTASTRPGATSVPTARMEATNKAVGWDASALGMAHLVPGS